MVMRGSRDQTPRGLGPSFLGKQWEKITKGWAWKSSHVPGVFLIEDRGDGTFRPLWIGRTSAKTNVTYTVGEGGKTRLGHRAGAVPSWEDAAVALSLLHNRQGHPIIAKFQRLTPLSASEQRTLARAIEHRKHFA